MSPDGRSTPRLQSLLFESVVPEPVAWLFLAGGVPVVIWGLLAGTTLPAGGASQLVVVCTGSGLAVWGLSELLPRRYRRGVALLRLVVLVGGVVAAAALLLVVVFWWGLQQPP